MKGTKTCSNCFFFANKTYPVVQSSKAIKSFSFPEPLSCALPPVVLAPECFAMVTKLVKNCPSTPSRPPGSEPRSQCSPSRDVQTPRPHGFLLSKNKWTCEQNDNLANHDSSRFKLHPLLFAIWSV